MHTYVSCLVFVDFDFFVISIKNMIIIPSLKCSQLRSSSSAACNCRVRQKDPRASVRVFASRDFLEGGGGGGGEEAS